MYQHAKPEPSTERDKLCKHVATHASNKQILLAEKALNYKMPGGYINSKSLTCIGVASIVAWGENFNESTRMTFDHYFLSWLHNNNPLYCTTEELTSALLKTDTLEQADILKTLKWSLSQIMICIPKGLITTPTGGYIDFIGITCGETKSKGRFITAYTVDTNRGVWISESGEYELACIKESFEKIEEMNELESKVVSNLGSFAINILLLLETSSNSIFSDVLESETTTNNKSKKGFGNKDKELSPKYPRWIGKNYKAKTERLPTSNSHGIHLSLRTHWRRGHWRCIEPGEGKQWKESKRLWIEPVLINAGVE